MMSFDISIKLNDKVEHIKNIKLNLLGRHNVLNATAAIGVAKSLGVKNNIIKATLKNFLGVQRRLTKISNFRGSIIYDDYAHHPTEIISVLNAIKSSFENKKIVTVFQPHRYSRVALLKKEFANASITESGIKYIVINKGTGNYPVATSNVKVHYTGMLLNGKIFDSSVERNQTIDFGLNQVIPGWTEGVQLMPAGSKYKFFIPYNLAYGERGAGQDIPPYSTLIFEVELLKVNGK